MTSSTSCTVDWHKDWSFEPLLDPAACRHPGPSSMAIGLRFVTSGNRTTIATDASICMQCGTDTSGRMEPGAVLEAAWAEHGWHRSTGERLQVLAARGGQS